MALAPEGLSHAEVTARIERGDVNRVVPPTSRSAQEIIRANVLTRFNALLGTLFVVILVVGPWQDALFGGVLIVNALLGIVQELRAKRMLDRLALTTQPRGRAIRAGRIVTLAAAEIVLDDILELTAGDQVLVDGVMLTSNGLDIDESLLTGESEPLAKEPGDDVLSGSQVVAGTGRYRVTQVGASTYAYRLASEAKRFHVARSELQAGIDRILRYVTWAIVPTAALLFANQFAAQLPVAEALLFSAAGVVAMVPEGLVLLTSLALAVGAVRLARKQTLVQGLPAIETLARVDVVCLDKTGTLTEREPQVEHVDFFVADHPDAMRALAAVAAADPNPNATLQAIGRAYPLHERHDVIAFVPFSSQRKWSSATLTELGTWMIGAPDVLLAGISGNDAVRRRAEEHVQAGRRVLLLARADCAPASDRMPLDLVPVAFVLLVEHLRDEAAEAVRYFHEEGVAIKVISGDHPNTVGQIASRVGIPNSGDPVDARTLPENAQALAELVETRSIFGRISPQQKQSVIASLQAKGHVVAMVGDGVNDILALKKADVGIAMGAGAAAARAVSQLILLDNRFAKLPAVVAEGRRVIGNVERLAALFLTKTVYAMLLAFIVGIAGVTFPFLPRHLTLVGALTIGIPAFFLSLERNAERAHPGFVERVLGFAVPSGMFVAGATFAVYALVHTYLGANLGEARTAATAILFVVAAGALMVVVQPLTLTRCLLVASMVAMFMIVLAVPELRSFFALDRLSWSAWFAVIGIAAVAAGVQHWSSVAAAHRNVKAVPSRPWQAKEVLAWLLGVDSPKWFLLMGAVLVVGGAWLFFGVLEDVVSHDPLVDVDIFVYQLLQSVRTPTVDSAMVAVTELGDVQVLLPVIVVALVWFVAHRFWLTAGYWLAAVGVAELLTKVLKLALHRQRPGAFYLWTEQFSFPSGHATMSVVVYEFLAVLLCRELGADQRKRVMLTTTALIVLIAFSRLYLGAHWLSDVLGGLAFGAAWVALLAMAYIYQSGEQIYARKLAIFVAMTLVVVGSVHIATQHTSDVFHYAKIVLSTQN